MHWIDKFRMADIHREVYVAILKSWIPHGQKGKFARECGIAREYLSCLCVLDGAFNESLPIHKRHPSPSLAGKMAQVLPAPDEIKRSLVENMTLAHINALDAQGVSRTSVTPGLLVERLAELEQTHRQATFGKDLTEVKRAYRLLRDASRHLLRYVQPEEYPDTFSQICLYYHDAQCILNRPDEALLYAKTAQLVLESIEQIESGYSRKQRDELEINAIRGEAIAYHNLGLDRIVPDILLNRACSTSAYRNARHFWEPLVKRDLINSLAETPRFSIREVNKTAQQIAKICEKNGDEFTFLLVREGWLRSLIRRGKTKAAERIFKEEMERLPRLPYVGALHRALLFKSGARLAWALRDREVWSIRIAETVGLMSRAGLTHQISLIRRIYGSAVESVLAQPGIDPIESRRA